MNRYITKRVSCFTKMLVQKIANFISPANVLMFTKSSFKFPTSLTYVLNTSSGRVTCKNINNIGRISIDICSKLYTKYPIINCRSNGRISREYITTDAPLAIALLDIWINSVTSVQDL